MFNLSMYIKTYFEASKQFLYVGIYRAAAATPRITNDKQIKRRLFSMLKSGEGPINNIEIIVDVDPKTNIVLLHCQRSITIPMTGAEAVYAP